MSGRRRKALSPSLFPFLAVLVCTLGTLILLLALVAQNATDAAEQSAQAEQQAQQEVEKAKPKPARLEATAVAAMIEEEEFRVTQLVAFRDKQTGDVEQRRDQLTHLEDHISRVRDQLKRLSEEVERATGEAPSNVIDQSAIVKLQDEIAKKESYIAELRKSARHKKPRVVIVPHKGPNGTTRRPIYVECTKDGVTIWPEGSRITTLQLSDSISSANPLDAALRAVRFQAMQVYQDSVPPYPLLVVRPDGLEAYAGARFAMQDWDDQFGYELVPADVELAFAKPDAALKKNIDVAIREAVIHQHARHAIASRGSGRYDQRLPVLSAKSLAGESRAGGYKPLRGQHTPNGTRSPYTGGSNYASGQHSSGQSYSSGQPYSSGQTYSSRTSPTGTGSSTQPGSGVADSSSPAIRQLDDRLRQAAQEMKGTGSPGQSSGALSDRAVADSLAKTNPFLNSANGDDPSSIGSPNAGDSGESSDKSDATNNNTDDEKNADANLGEGQSEQVPNDPSSRGQFVNGQAAAGGGSKRTGSAGAQPGQNQSAPPAGSSSGSSSQSMPSPPQNQIRPESRPPSVSASGSAGRELVNRQGRQWALPSSLVGARGNKIIRTIRVQCYEDRLVLLPPGSGGATEMFGYSDGEINRATLQLATAVRDRVERWGAAIPGGRWQPRLDVQIMPGGDARFHQLRTLMNGSGVEVTGRKSR